MAETSALPDAVRAYGLLARTWIRVSMTYRTSFVILTVAQFVVTGLDFLAIVIMFANIDALGGFSLAEVAFLYGGAGVCLGLADLILGNIEHLGSKIRLGTFDAMMIRPVPLYAQVCADEFALRRLGRIAQAAVVLALGRRHARPRVDPARRPRWWPTWWCAARRSSWRSSPSARRSSSGPRTPRRPRTRSPTAATRSPQFPLTIYPAEMVKALTFLVPIAFVNWYPSLYVLGRPDPFGLPEAFQFAAPVAALALGLLAAVAWRTGVRRYRSTGS